ncbi:hypothetical protein BTVI_126040 [Pitangus sulphuratus]|nr:hypothetical protein BTVI_126040 [Pitangus sulphuratus]
MEARLGGKSIHEQLRGSLDTLELTKAQEVTGKSYGKSPVKLPKFTLITSHHREAHQPLREANIKIISETEESLPISLQLPETCQAFPNARKETAKSDVTHNHKEKLSWYECLSRMSRHAQKLRDHDINPCVAHGIMMQRRRNGVKPEMPSAEERKKILESMGKPY